MLTLKKISFVITTAALIIQISGCSLLSSSKKSLDNNKSISLISNSKYDDLIILELEKQGFKIVPHDSSRYQLNTEISNIVDWCQGKNSRKLENVTYKLNDIQEKSTIFILEDSGWTSGCEIYQSSVFNNLAKTLSKHWESPNSTWFLW